MRKKEEFDIVCKKYGIDLISLIAPTSHERVAQIAKDAEGFVYCVSLLVLQEQELILLRISGQW